MLEFFFFFSKLPDYVELEVKWVKKEKYSCLGNSVATASNEMRLFKNSSPAIIKKLSDVKFNLGALYASPTLPKLAVIMREREKNFFAVDIVKEDIFAAVLIDFFLSPKAAFI